MDVRYNKTLRRLLKTRLPRQEGLSLWFLGLDLNPVGEWVHDLYLKASGSLQITQQDESSCPTGLCQEPEHPDANHIESAKTPVPCGFMPNALLELELDESMYPGTPNRPVDPAFKVPIGADTDFRPTVLQKEVVEEETLINTIQPPEVVSPPIPILPIIPVNVEFSYLENAASNQILLLGNKLAGSSDPNPGGLLFFQAIDSVVIEPNGKIPDLIVTVVKTTATLGHDAVYLLTDCYGSATVTIDIFGNERIYDPNDIFRDMNGGDVLTIHLGFTITDPFEQTASASQKILIYGFGENIVANPDYYTVAEDGSLVIDAAQGKLANDTHVDTVPHPLVIDSTDSAATVESNLILTGGFGSLTLPDISVSDVVNLDPTVVHEYKFDVGSKEAFLIIYKDGSEVFINAEGAFEGMVAGDVLQIRVNYIVTDASPTCFPQPPATSYEIISVTGLNECPVANPDFYSTSEVIGLTIDATHGKLANDTDMDTAHSLLFISSTDLAVTVESNLSVTGGNGLLMASDISVSDVISLDPLVAHEYKFEVDGRSAYLIIYKDGAETLINNEGAFVGLAAGDTLMIKVNYQVNDGDPACLSDPQTRSYEIIAITGVNDFPVANPDFYTTTEVAGLNITAAQGKLANDTDVDTPHDQLFIASTDSAATVDSNLIITGGNGLLTVSDISVTDLISLDPLVAHEYKFEVDGKAAYLVIYKDGAEALINNEGAFVGLAAGDTLMIKVNYQVNDGDPACLSDPQTRSYEVITVTGLNDCPVANPDFFATTEAAGLNIIAAQGKLANDTDLDTPHDQLFIASTDSAATVDSNLVITGGNGLMTVGDINVTDLINLDPLVAHEYKFEVDGKAAYLILYKDGAETLINNEGAFVGLSAGDTLLIKVNYQVNDGDPACLSDPQTRSYETIAISGVDDCPVANPDFYTTNEVGGLNISAAQGKLANDIDYDTPHDQLFIASTDSAATVGSNLFIAGGAGLLNVNDISVFDVFNPNPLVVHEYKFEADGKAAYLIIYEDGSETLINNEGAFMALGAGDTLMIKVGYQVNDGDPECLLAPQTRSFEVISITGVNDCPEANPDFYTTTEAAGLTITAAQGKLANDIDIDTPNGALRISSTDVPIVDESAISSFAQTQLGDITVSVIDGDMSDGSVHYKITTALGTADIITDNLGNETLTIDHAFDGLNVGDTLVIKMDYQVNDGDPDCLNQAQTKSYELINVTGVNNAPVDGNEPCTFDSGINDITENANIELSAGFNLLDNATDVDTPHNQLVVSSLAMPTLTLEAGDFDISQITITPANDPTAPFDYTFSSSSGITHLTVLSDGSVTWLNFALDGTTPGAGAFDVLGADDQIEVHFDYTVSDGFATDTSFGEICIQGQKDIIPDPGNNIFPWFLFSYQQESDPGAQALLDSLKVIATVDPDHVERQFIKFQIVPGEDLIYNYDFNGDGVVDPGGEAVLFHNWTPAVDINGDPIMGFPAIIDVLIVQALLSGSNFYDVSNIKPNAEGGGVFDPNDPINSFFFLKEGLSTSSGAGGGSVPDYFTGTSGGNSPLNGNSSPDVLLGLDGNDTSTGNSSEDYINGGGGNDNLQGSSDTDFLDGGPGDDTIDGANGYDVLLGGSGADTISGGALSDIMYGGIDNDIDVMKGGAGDSDLFVFAVTTNGSGQLVLLSNNDVVIDFSPDDYLGFLDYSSGNVLANTDVAVQDFFMDSLGKLGTDVVVTTGHFVDANGAPDAGGNIDTKLTFAGGGQIVLYNFNDTSVITNLFNAAHLQVIDANGA